jgi:hypothetical protein
MKQNELKKSATSVQTHLGAAIRGEKVTCQYRKMSRPMVTTGSSTHQIQQTKLEGTVFCVIDRPLNYLRDLPANQSG